MADHKTDIVERLLATGGKGQCGPLRAEAADEIKRLRAERHRLSSKLCLAEATIRAGIEDIRETRAALNGKEG